MIRIAVLILILVFVCAVYVLHAKMEEDEEKSGNDMQRWRKPRLKRVKKAAKRS